MGASVYDKFPLYPKNLNFKLVEDHRMRIERVMRNNFLRGKVLVDRSYTRWTQRKASCREPSCLVQSIGLVGNGLFCVHRV